MSVWPDTVQTQKDGVMAIGGIATTELAHRFGTPLYVYDETTLRQRARTFVNEFAVAWPRSRVAYAAKAFLSLAVLRILHEEGLALDVSSGGEIYGGLAAGVPATEMTFHGNAKTLQELTEALDSGIGLIAVDNLTELDTVAQLASDRRICQRILLRLNPGIDVHTHAKIKTGVLDSKFGLAIATGDAERAVEKALAEPSLVLAGYHTHLGSQLFDPPALATGIDALLEFAAAMRDAHGVTPHVISPGGGFGIPYAAADPRTPVHNWAVTLADSLRLGCQGHRLPEPELAVEPGRSIVGPAAITLYRVGPVKEIPGGKRFVSVDGGMADNIRPTLYGAHYEARIANREATDSARDQSIVGKYCETGDVLIEQAQLQQVNTGDLLAVAATGAYCLAMASNYNLAIRPAVVLVRDGEASLIRRRETYDDLLSREVSTESIIGETGTVRTNTLA